MTLLERWDLRLSSRGAQYVSDDEIRRAIAIAQAVDEQRREFMYEQSANLMQRIRDRADELLAGKSDE